MQAKYRLYGKLPIAGLGFYQIKRVKDELQIGTELHLLREPNNSYDAKAVAVYYKGYMLGHVPNAHMKINHKYARLLDASLTELFYVTVASLDFRDPDPFEWTVEFNVMLRLDGARYYSLTPDEEQMINSILDTDLSGILASFSTDKTLRAMLAKRKVDVSYTAKWELKDFLAVYDPRHEEIPIGINPDEDDVIGEYFTSLNGAASGLDVRLKDYPLICVYLNRIDRLSKGNADDRRWMICMTLIHECMHALFDHQPNILTHPYDSYLEEPTCECGTIMIAQLIDVHYPGFGDWVLKTVDSKKNKYGLGADLYKYWPGSQDYSSNAVDEYNRACDHIIKDSDKFVNWTGRMDPKVAIPEMLDIYKTAKLNKKAGLSNQANK